MGYQAKTNWKPDDPVTEHDLNRIESGIGDAYNSIESIQQGVGQEFGELKEEVAAHKEKIATNETNITGLTNRVSSAESKIKEIESTPPSKVQYYLSADGDDSNSGSITEPFKTISRAINMAENKKCPILKIRVLSDIKLSNHSYSGQNYRYLKQIEIYGTGINESGSTFDVQRANNGFIDFYDFDRIIMSYMSLSFNSSQIINRCTHVKLTSVHLYGGLSFSLSGNPYVSIINCKVEGEKDRLKDYGFGIWDCGLVVFKGDSSVSHRSRGLNVVQSIVTGINNLKYANCEQNLVTNASLVS